MGDRCRWCGFYGTRTGCELRGKLSQRHVSLLSIVWSAGRGQLQAATEQLERLENQWVKGS